MDYLSPSSIAMSRQDFDAFYLQYLAKKRKPRDPQTQPMSIGSSFDAYIKADLNQKLFGNNRNPKFEFDTLFTAQVEKQHRDWARTNGKIVFDAYVEYGALSDLLIELENAIGAPRLESEVYGVISGYREGRSATIAGVPLLGKPDVYFINKLGAHVIHDWKVNGYCSNWGASPAAGFVKIRGKNEIGGHHKDAQLGLHHGVMINIAQPLNTTSPEWADQLSIYSWLCGEQIGSDFIASIDQVVCRKGVFRFAQHRATVEAEYQWHIFETAQKLWEIVNSDHIYRDLTLEESKARCQLLEDRMSAPAGPQDELFNELTRPR